jgi:beta-lactamase regulating signal transducer with metallopeptidase domain
LPTPRSDGLISLPDAWWTSTVVLLAAWILWAASCVVRFAAAIVAIRRARACSRPFPSSAESRLTNWVRLRPTGRPARLVLSETVTHAAVLGWGTPIIAVSPLLLTTLDAQELDRIVVHEWAHVQRRDDLLQVLQLVAHTIVGWHPAVWWLGRRLSVEREIACDEMTVAITGSPKTYAACLIKLASLRRPARPLQAAPAVLTSSGLRARIVKIVGHPLMAPMWSRGIAVAIVSVLGLLSAQVSGWNLVEAAELALPVVSAQARGAALHRLTPMALPMSLLDIRTDRPLQRTRRVSPPQPRQTEQRPLEQPTTEPAVPVTSEGTHADSMAPTQAPRDAADMPALATVPQIPPDWSDASIAKARAPWTAAADGGVALGRKSKDAGLATAGFFTRFARRVAGSF